MQSLNCQYKTHCTTSIRHCDYKTKQVVQPKSFIMSNLATIKNLTREAAFKDLVDIQLRHSKVKDIKYETFKCQPYLSSGMFSNEEVSILASLRSHTLRTIRGNFKNFYQGNLSCPLKCWPEGSTPLNDTQEHLLVCSRLDVQPQTTLACGAIKYDDIYGSRAEQKAVTSVVKQCMETRNQLLEQDKQPTSGPSSTLDPST